MDLSEIVTLEGEIPVRVSDCGPIIKSPNITTLTVQLTGTQPWSLRIDVGTSVTNYNGVSTPGFNVVLLCLLSCR